MTFKGGMQAGSNRFGRGGSTGAKVGGGIGGLVIVVVALIFGINPSTLTGIVDQVSGGGTGSTVTTEGSVACPTSDTANDSVECRLEWTGRSLDAVWSQVLPEQAGIEYQAPGGVLFTDTVNTACGFASAATGPFFCPGDGTSYFDTTFFNQLEQLGAGAGPLSQEYVVAHEWGHAIQTMEGTIGLSDYNNPGEDSMAVKIETQADCYAGLWAHHASQGEDAFLEPITDQQIRDVIQTAQAIGDDNIQRRSGGEVRPDQWTHGSSQQRAEAFMTGYQTGDMARCDTLGRGAYANS